MTVEDHRRIALHRAAAESWGEEVADTLADLVVPSGHELATRQDIEGVLLAMSAMDERWDERLAALEVRWDERLSGLELRWDERLGAAELRWDERLSAMDERIAGLELRWDERLGAAELRWDERMGAMDERITAMELRWDERLAAMDTRWQIEMQGTRDQLLGAFERRIADAVNHQTRTLVFSQLGALVVIAALAFGLR